MLTLCYVDDEQLQVLSPEKNPFKSIRSVRGDVNAKKILDCLLSLIHNYGEQIILILCFPHLIEMVRLAVLFAEGDFQDLEFHRFELQIID